MTKDEALTMIIASIAMEELALSHIVNAEGEKLQYILGTLPGGHRSCASPQEILAVNKSVKGLLDTVTQNQMLLKGKLEMALEAGNHAPKPAPDPPCPCKPVKPDESPCCGKACSEKSAIHLVSRCHNFSWGSGSLLSWKRHWQRGFGIRWNEKAPALVRLDSEKVYVLNYAINICAPYSGDGAGTISVKLTPCGTFSSILPLYFSVKCSEHDPLTLHYSATLSPQACPAPYADLSLLLDYSGSLNVNQATLSIVEI